MAAQIKEAIGTIHPLLITNMAKDQRDNNAGRIIQLVAEKYLTIQAEDIGAIEYDPMVEKMVSRMIPILELTPRSPARANAARLVKRLISKC